MTVFEFVASEFFLLLKVVQDASPKKRKTIKTKFRGNFSMTYWFLEDEKMIG